jgi:hypothetical protein
LLFFFEALEASTSAIESIIGVPFATSTSSVTVSERIKGFILSSILSSAEGAGLESFCSLGATLRVLI